MDQQDEKYEQWKRHQAEAFPGRQRKLDEYKKRKRVARMPEIEAKERESSSSK